MAGAAPAGPVITGAVLDSMSKYSGAGGGFKGGLQVFFGGKQWPAITTGMSVDLQQMIGGSLENISPKFLSGHMGIAPNILPGFGGGILGGSKSQGGGGIGADH